VGGAINRARRGTRPAVGHIFPYDLWRLTRDATNVSPRPRAKVSGRVTKACTSQAKLGNPDVRLVRFNTAHTRRAIEEHSLRFTPKVVGYYILSLSSKTLAIVV
jgi:hypothetical protein